MIVESQLYYQTKSGHITNIIDTNIIKKHVSSQKRIVVVLIGSLLRVDVAFMTTYFKKNPGHKDDVANHACERSETAE